MDFLENVNEDVDLRYEEKSEFDCPMLAVICINDDDGTHRFYDGDIIRIIQLLKEIKLHPNLDITLDLNESYQLKYYGMRDVDESVLVIKDLEYDNNYNLYPEDIQKIGSFLNRLIEFKVIKI